MLSPCVSNIISRYMLSGVYKMDENYIFTNRNKHEKFIKTAHVNIKSYSMKNFNKKIEMNIPHPYVIKYLKNSVPNQDIFKNPHPYAIKIIKKIYKQMKEIDNITKQIPQFMQEDYLTLNKKYIDIYKNNPSRWGEKIRRNEYKKFNIFKMSIDELMNVLKKPDKCYEETIDKMLKKVLLIYVFENPNPKYIEMLPDLMKRYDDDMYAIPTIIRNKNKKVLPFIKTFNITADNTQYHSHIWNNPIFYIIDNKASRPWFWKLANKLVI